MPLQVRNPSVELSWPSRLASTYRSVPPQLRSPSEFELQFQPPKKLPPLMRGRDESQKSAIDETDLKDDGKVRFLKPL